MVKKFIDPGRKKKAFNANLNIFRRKLQMKNEVVKEAKIWSSWNISFDMWTWTLDDNYQRESSSHLL
jgi:hypothetical protein